jgi:hypothetical protein
VEDWAEIRRLHRAEGLGIKTAAKTLGAHATRRAAVVLGRAAVATSSSAALRKTRAPPVPATSHDEGDAALFFCAVHLDVHVVPLGPQPLLIVDAPPLFLELAVVMVEELRPLFVLRGHLDHAPLRRGYECLGRDVRGPRQLLQGCDSPFVADKGDGVRDRRKAESQRERHHWHDKYCWSAPTSRQPDEEPEPSGGLGQRDEPRVIRYKAPEYSHHKRHEEGARLSCESYRRPQPTEVPPWRRGRFSR